MALHYAAKLDNSGPAPFGAVDSSCVVRNASRAAEDRRAGDRRSNVGTENSLPASGPSASSAVCGATDAEAPGDAARAGDRRRKPRASPQAKGRRGGEGGGSDRGEGADDAGGRSRGRPVNLAPFSCAEGKGAREAASETHLSDSADPEARLKRIIEADSGRDCNADYPIPKWLSDQGVTSPFVYFRSFKSSLGIINYDISGPPSQPLVVTFHGLNGTQLSFFDLQSVLARFGYRTLIFDLYGHGLSATPRYSFFLKRYGLKFFVKQTDELLEHLGLQNERISVVGFSMGCVIAAAYALHRIDFVDHICLVAPAGMLPKKPLPVKVLQRCGWCVSPCCCLVPTCVCRCCFSKKNFVQRYEEEEHEERRRSACPSRQSSVSEPKAELKKKGFSLRWKRSSKRESDVSPRNGSSAHTEAEPDELSASQCQTAAAGAAASAISSAVSSAASAVAAGAAAGAAGDGKMPQGEKGASRRGETAERKKADGEEVDAASSNSPPGAGELLWRRLMWQLYVKKGVVATFVGCVTHIPLWDAKAIYAKVGETGRPVLFLWGQEDTVAPISCSHALRALIPNSHLIAFPGCPHLVLADRAQASIACIMAFLDFPATCDMRTWRYALPFDAEGTYLPPAERAPPGTSACAYLRDLHYTPRYTIRLGGDARHGMCLRRRPSSAPAADAQPQAPPSRAATAEPERMRERICGRRLGGVSTGPAAVGRADEAPEHEREESEDDDDDGEHAAALPVENVNGSLWRDAHTEGSDASASEQEDADRAASAPHEETRPPRPRKKSETVRLPRDGFRSRSSSMAAAAAAASPLLSFDSSSAQEILLRGQDHASLPSLPGIKAHERVDLE
ncbi:hypothetical protein BESB_002110 [Besnoitia besnoiti]|uniref:AB hydrolase-1 domain-containing protein n=1 Tax=Besnoitia besnoiti TaxID=94643 RepID=A0A2A9MPR8_BESBE|nr:hypothetical protein BESB_002110 [Besnoitia besnoiti]PFH37870.1 hypothetical protein BESB_002110 [Besnoitia besnoiti]